MNIEPRLLQPRVLVVAATARELAPCPAGSPGLWHTLLCGVGPVEAAAATAAAIAVHRPDLLLHVGIAGARQARALAAGTLVIGSESRYSDLVGIPESWAPHSIPAPDGLLIVVQRALPHAITMPIGTSARVGGSVACDVEAMEGFGVLRAAQLANVPAIELRAVSNDIEEADRARWHFDTAFAAITSITPVVVAALHHQPVHA